VEGPDFYANRPAYCRCNWIGAGMGSIDPVKEEQANTLCLENNSDTLENICARKGLDFEEVLDQRMIEIQMMTERGLAGPNVGAVMTSTPGQEDTVKRRAA
jgi:capsid protein